MNPTQQQLANAIAIINAANNSPVAYDKPKATSSWGHKLVGLVFLVGCAIVSVIWLQRHDLIKTEEASNVARGVFLTEKQELKVKSRLKENIKLINIDNSRKIAQQAAEDQTDAEFEAINRGVKAKFSDKIAIEKEAVARFKCNTGIGECPIAKNISTSANVYQAEGTPVIRKDINNVANNKTLQRKPMFSFQEAMGISNANAKDVFAPKKRKASMQKYDEIGMLAISKNQ